MQSKTEKFINTKRHKWLLGVKGQFIERDFKNKFLGLLGWVVDVGLTGLTLWVIIIRFPDPISLGLLSYVVRYYLKDLLEGIIRLKKA